PQQNKAGFGVQHHLDVNNLRVGQWVVHYANNHIRAVGSVAEAPYEAGRPAELDNGMWDRAGYICPIDYRELGAPIHREEIPDRSTDVGPFDVNGNVKQGYLFRVSNE